MEGKYKSYILNQLLRLQMIWVNLKKKKQQRRERLQEILGKIGTIG